MRVKGYGINDGRNGENKRNNFPVALNEPFPKILLNIITPVTELREAMCEKFNINFKF
jgi:hypothetical protein